MRPTTPLWSAPLRLLLAAGVLGGLRLRYRFFVYGRLPRRRGSTLVVANHQHDLESVVLPALILLGGPWRDPVVAVASQRLFERGFLTSRVPRPILGRLVQNWSLAGLLTLVGALPLENEPRSRSLSSLAQEVAARHGNLAAESVFTPGVLAALTAGGPTGALRLADLWGPGFARAARRPVPLSGMREPYREEVRRDVRPRIDAQFRRIEAALAGGGTVYLTPEGHVTRDGRLGRLHAALDRLLPLAGSVVLAAVNFDPFLDRRLTLRCRLVPLEGPGALEDRLRAARPVCTSQLLARWLETRAPDGGFDAAQALSGVERELVALPGGVVTAPGLSDPKARRALVGRALGTMARLGYLREDAGTYTRTSLRFDRRLHEPADIFAHQCAVLEETAAAAERLASARA